MDELQDEDEFAEEFEIFSYPVFLVMKYGKLHEKFDASTSITLYIFFTML